MCEQLNGSLNKTKNIKEIREVSKGQKNSCPALL
jgi:hypothetical protein